jgi:nucleoside-triphosphatase THEP1
MEIFRSGAKAVLSIKKDDVVSWLAEIKQLPNARLVELTEETRDQVFTELSGYINNNLPN